MLRKIFEITTCGMEDITRGISVTYKALLVCFTVRVIGVNGLTSISDGVNKKEHRISMENILEGSRGHGEMILSPFQEPGCQNLPMAGYVG
jgi:hypothetical protein